MTRTDMVIKTLRHLLFNCLFMRKQSVLLSL